ELTPDEWNDYKRLAENKNRKEYAAFEDFYRAAEARDRVFADAVDKDGINMVVAGGFHAPGLKTLLESQGRRVILLRPKFTVVSENDASGYLSVFAKEKTPLERLFSRWKLFLAPPAEMGTAPLVELNHADPDLVLIERETSD